MSTTVLSIPITWHNNTQVIHYGSAPLWTTDTACVTPDQHACGCDTPRLTRIEAASPPAHRTHHTTKPCFWNSSEDWLWLHPVVSTRCHSQREPRNFDSVAETVTGSRSSTQAYSGSLGLLATSDALFTPLPSDSEVNYTVVTGL